MSARLDRNDPGCYHSMLRYLSEKTGISLFKEIIKQQVWVTSRHTGKKKLVYIASNITVVDKEGNRHAFMKDQKRYDLRGIEANYFAVSVLRDSEEFGIKINDAGNYRDSLGGGWYSNCSLLEVDGKYFATMECACNHNGYLVNPAVKDSVNIDMNNFDPNAPQVNQDQEAIKEQATEQAPTPTVGEAQESAEEGTTEG